MCNIDTCWTLECQCTEQNSAIVKTHWQCMFDSE